MLKFMDEKSVAIVSFLARDIGFDFRFILKRDFKKAHFF
jgi:hypothetical protein